MRDLFNRLTLKAGVVLAVLLLTVPATVVSQSGPRQIIDIPDIPGYQTLKCDFHMHTMFSDGIVWPTVRVQEAVYEGLDAIAITDHDDYVPHKADIPVYTLTRPYEIAKPAADAAGIILIPGLEISRNEPYGHHNAIFVTDLGAYPFWDNNAAAPVDTLANYRTAAKQGAFLFWNHPWAMPPLWGVGRPATWTAAQDTMYANGWLGGIEVVNGDTYNANAHRFCIEKKLTLMGNSDVHNLIAYEYNLFEGGHRPMTLVFARERTLDGIKEALQSRRTAVWSGDTLIGESQYLLPIFEQAVTASATRVELAPGNRMTVLLSNDSDIPVTLERIPGGTELQKMIEVPQKLMIPAHRSVPVQIRRQGGQNATSQSGWITYQVTNFIVAPDRGLDATLPVEIVFRPAR